MIKFSNKIVDSVINYLNKEHPQTEDVDIKIIENYEVIETPDGVGFGVFVPEQKVIYIASDLPDKETSLITTIAHEYMHFIQYCEHRSFDEDEAEKFAEEILIKMKKEI